MTISLILLTIKAGTIRVYPVVVLTVMIRATLTYEDLALPILIKTTVQCHMLIVQVPLLLLLLLLLYFFRQSIPCLLLCVRVLVHSAETGAEQTVFFFVIDVHHHLIH